MTKILRIIGIFLAVIVLAGGAYLLFAQKAKQNDTKPTPTITARDLQNTFMIIPNDYQFTDADKQVINNSTIKELLISEGEQSYILQTQATFSNLTVEALEQSGTYTKCQNTSSSPSTDTARTTPSTSYSIGYKSCDSNNIIKNITEFTCDISSVSCQSEFLSGRKSASYIYFDKYPLVALDLLPQAKTEQFSHAIMLTWGENLSSLAQAAYSIEILNSSNKRIHATGKVNATNQGDWFVPTSSLTPQQLTAKLKIWYKLGSTTFSVPEVITQTFAYMGTTPQQSNGSAVTQSAWIPDWGMQAGIESVQKDPSKWAAISPVWFTADKKGNLLKERTFNSSALITLLRNNHIKIIPTISLFDADILKSILENNLEKHITEITNTVVDNNYDGIDLDYESTYVDDKALLTQFVTELANQLHAHGKTLSFTALPKIDDREIYAFLPQTHQAQDWQALGQVVDEFRIMAYDFTGQGSDQPGPLSPYLWDETLIKYAVAKMPAEKIVLALPIYSHAWPKPTSTNLAGNDNDKSLSSGKTKNTISLQHDDIAYVKSHSSYYRESYDSWNKEVKAEFKYKGIERVMYYLNKKAVDERIQLAQKYGIKGICYWRIGGETL